MQRRPSGLSARLPLGGGIYIQCSDGHLDLKDVPAYLKMSGTTVTGYIDSEENPLPAELVIPDGVTGISSRAFYGCDKLTSVTIPGSVDSIGGGSTYDGAFGQCTNLETVTIKEGVKSIGDNAFRGCTSLMSVTIPDSVERIDGGLYYDHGVFRGCTKLTSVTIGAGVKSIGGGAFSDCESLTSVTYTGTLADWCGIDWEEYSANPLSNENAVLYVGSPSEPVTGAVIPDGVTEIKAYAFYNYKSLTGVTIGKDVTRIGDYAFRDCENLKTVTIPASVTSIGSRAFEWCRGLRVTYEGSLAQWCVVDNDWGLMEYADAVFVDGRDLKTMDELTIPAGVTKIGEYAFSDCANLKTVTMGGDVTSIGDCAFSGCESLTGVEIPANVTNIGKGAFSGCESLTGVEIPANVTNIGKGAFSGCSSLSGVTIPGSVTTIYCNTFVYCTNLTSVTIEEGVKSIEGAFYSGDNGAFEECRKLERVTIPASMTSIGSNAFRLCSGIKEVHYNGDLAQWCGISWSNSAANPLDYGDDAVLLYIGGNPVTGAVTIPGGVTAIKDYAFYGYEKLTSVTIVNDVNSIGYGAFEGCTSLTDVTIGKNVTSIGYSAFYYCTVLNTITYEGTSEQWISVFGQDYDDWDYRAGDFTIHCEGDGKTLDKNGNVIEE